MRENGHSLKDLRINDLELFISAALLKNLGKAALLHHMSQSAASAAILRVEASFDRPLCTHEKRKFCLTQEGQQLLPRAEDWVRQLRDIVASSDLLPIRLATTHAIARVTVPAALSVESIDLQLMRPDQAYGAILRDEADVAIVLDNAPWEGVTATEIGRGCFQLYSGQKEVPRRPVLLPEDQIEVLSLQRRWHEIYGEAIPVKARLPSWSLIADICSCSLEIGFLPDFLAAPSHLYPVAWQPKTSRYRILSLFRNLGEPSKKRVGNLIRHWQKALMHDASDV